MEFKDLNLSTPLLNALVDMGYDTPTTIQERTLPVGMSGKDMVGIAQTGTGKTIAYLLPCLRLWKFSKERFPQTLILVPTRELVVQVVEEAKRLTKYMNVEVAGVYGGVNMANQVVVCHAGLDILVATPGRLMDLSLHGALKLKAIKRLVIDEVDEMMNLGFRPQLIRVFDLLPEKRQNLMFSATITEEVEVLINDFFLNPILVEAAPTGTPLKNIQQEIYRVPNFNTKINLLTHLLKENTGMSKVLIFTSTKALANQLHFELEQMFPETVGVIHSNKTQNTRFNAINRFSTGENKYLIATDIIARGIDVAEVSHVINFDMPDSSEGYIHRIGRTGRADKKGHSIAFVMEKEVEQLAAIEDLMNSKIAETAIPEEVEISEFLTEAEKPQLMMKNYLPKPKARTEGMGGYHEKLEKNKKINNRNKYREELALKYKRPRRKKQKRK